MLLKKLAIIALSSAFILTGCDNSEKSQNNVASKIRVGIVSGPEEEITEVAKQQAKEKYNLDVELVVFNDYVTPNQALNDGLIDVNAFQHKPYLDKQSQDRGFKLVIVGNTLIYPIAAYSHKLKPVDPNSISEQGKLITSPRGESYFIKQGATIAVPNDPTNLGRALLLLQAQGLISLDESKGLLPTSSDITKNEFGIKIIEIEGPLLPHSLDDAQVDLAIINNTFAGRINLAPNKDGLFVEDKESPYVNIIVSRDDNADNINVINFVKAYQTEATEKKAEEIFKGGAIKGW